MMHLKHKDHGYHIAYTSDEIKACKKNGWIECDMAKEHEKARKAKGAAEEEIKAEQELGEAVVEKAKKSKSK